MNMAETSSIQALIHSHMNAFTRSEKIVAQFVLDRLTDIIYLSVTDLAEQADVGETTVLRFCRKVGFKGYQEFKLAIAQDHVQPISNLYGDVNQDDELQVMMQKITNTNIKSLQETLSLLDPKQLEYAIDLLNSAKRIHFYGVGTSGITALDAKSKFLRIGLQVDAVSDSHLQAMAAATLTAEDVAVGITVSGSTKDTVDALKLAKENGAKVIAITQFARSPVTKVADAILLMAGKEMPLQGGSLAAKIAQLHTIDLLFTGLSMRTSDKSLYYKEKTAKAVIDKIY